MKNLCVALAVLIFTCEHYNLDGSIGKVDHKIIVNGDATSKDLDNIGFALCEAIADNS